MQTGLYISIGQKIVPSRLGIKLFQVFLPPSQRLIQSNFQLFIRFLLNLLQLLLVLFLQLLLYLKLFLLKQFLLLIR